MWENGREIARIKLSKIFVNNKHLMKCEFFFHSLYAQSKMEDFRISIKSSSTLVFSFWFISNSQTISLFFPNTLLRSHLLSHIILKNKHRIELWINKFSVRHTSFILGRRYALFINESTHTNEKQCQNK